MNVFCQTDKVLPQNGDVPVWDTAEGRWMFRPGGSTPPDPGEPTDPDEPINPDEPIDPDQPEEPVSTYEIGEWKDWYRASPLPKWKVRNGELLTDVSANFPELLAYLKLPENTWMLKDEPEWQELSRAAGGIGGVWYYSLDEGADTIRLPDTRGDFSRDAGGRKGDGANDGVYGVGEWHGDTIRNLKGDMGSADYEEQPEYGLLWGMSREEGAAKNSAYIPPDSGPFTAGRVANYTLAYDPSVQGRTLAFDASLAVPTAHENRPRAGMLLGCVYVGR